MKKFIPRLKKVKFILVEGEAEEKFFKLLNKKFGLNLEIFPKKSKNFFKDIKEFNKAGFFKILGKQKQESKYKDSGNIVYVIFDFKDEEFQNLDKLQNNIKKFSKTTFLKGGEIDHFYSNPCFEKVLLVLAGKNKCFENNECENLKREFYGKKRTNLDLIEKLVIDLSKKDILESIEKYFKKCKILDKDILYFIKKLLV